MPPVGDSVISSSARIVSAAVRSRFRSSSLTYPVQHRVADDAVDDARPGLRFQPFLPQPERRVLARAALRPDLSVPRDLRPREREHLAEHDRLT
jgi:hypothetical protein